MPKQAPRESREKKDDLGYTQEELQAAIDKYYFRVETRKEKANDSDLAAAIGITDKQLEKFALEYEKGVETSIRKGHAEIIYKAVQKLRGIIKQRGDVTAMFWTKQPLFGGFTDKQETAVSGGVDLKISLTGMGKNENPFD